MSQDTNGRAAERMPGTEVVAKAKRRQYTAEYTCACAQVQASCVFYAK